MKGWVVMTPRLFIAFASEVDQVPFDLTGRLEKLTINITEEQPRGRQYYLQHYREGRARAATVR